MKTKNIAFALALFMSVSAFAQHNEEVTIEGSYRPKVNKVDKILIQPEKPQQSFEMPSTEVEVLDIEYRFPLELEKFNALSYSGQNQTPKPAKNFLMAGFGSRISPVFLYKHNSNLTKNLGLGVGIKHYSSWLDMKDYAPSSFMNNAFDIGLTSNKYKDVQLGGNVYYKNDICHYNGYEPQQVYNTIGARFGLASKPTRNGEYVNDLDLDYHYLFGKVGGGKEHNATLGYDLAYVDSWWGKKNHPQKLGMALGVQYANTAFDGRPNVDRMIFKVNPYFEMKDDFYRLHLGVRMDGGTKFESANGFLTVHPDLKGSLFVLNNILEFYAGMDGGRKLYTYSDLINENPFVGSALDLEVTTVKLGFEGGIRTNIMKTIDLHVGVRYRHTLNDPFYVVRGQVVDAQIVDNLYNVFYDETYLTSVVADVRWLASDQVAVDAGVTYNNYQMGMLDHALFRPEIEGRLKVNYNPTSSLSLYSSLLYQDGRYARSQAWVLTDPSVKLKAVLDLGLGADYKVAEDVTVFAKVNNLLHQKYQLYYNYPVNGIEFFAGLKMTF